MHRGTICIKPEEIDNVIKEIKSLEGITMDIGSMVTVRMNYSKNGFQQERKKMTYSILG